MPPFRNRARHGDRPLVHPLESRVTPSIVFHVTNVADTNVAGSGSLRRAITDANNSDPGFDGRVIHIEKAGTYTLSLNGTDEDANATGDLDILQTTTIDNQSNGIVTIDAGGLTTHDRVFDIGPNGEAITVRLIGITIEHGQAPAGGGIRVPSPSNLELTEVDLRDNKDDGGGGAGLFMLAGDLSLRDTTVENNIATGNGGGVFMAGNGRLQITTSFFTFNQSQGAATGQGGGAVLYNGTGNVEIFGSYFHHNTSVGAGGGLLNTHDAQVSIRNSTFDENRSNGAGGGILLLTNVASSISNTTFSDNVALVGGGLNIGGSVGIVSLQNDTIVSNTASNGGGIFNGSNTLRLTNTLVAKNLSQTIGDPDLRGGSVVDVANNFLGDNTGAEIAFPAGTPNAHGSFVGTSAAPLDPLLGPPVFDNNFRAGSGFGSLISVFPNLPNQGNNGVRDRGLDAGAPTSDERSLIRPSGPHVDIGAFEFQYPDLGVTTTPPQGPFRAGSPLTLSFTVTNSGPITSSGATLTVTLPAGTSVGGASVGFLVDRSLVTLAVPDLAKDANTTLTLTVTPVAGGPFNVAATLIVDPNVSNNSATVSLTALPKPVPATGSADITKMVKLTLHGKKKAAKTEQFTLTNTSTTAFQGPLGLVPTLKAGIKLKNASGQTAKKLKFVRVSPGDDNILDPGETVTFSLVFSKAFLPKQLRILAGAFT